MLKPGPISVSGQIVSRRKASKLLLFLVHSRLPHVAAITAVQCDAALLSPEHHQEILKLQLVGTTALAALAGARAGTLLGRYG